MQTNIQKTFLLTAAGKEAEAILRSCVHCGFCNATCPTYQLLGDELDGPRGRIYQIKQMLEGDVPGPETLLHLDRCLTCRNCETTCPSGVQYGKLLDIGREYIQQHSNRHLISKLQRTLLRQLLSSKKLFALLTRMAVPVKKWLPESLQHTFASAEATIAWPTSTHTRRMLILDGCVQPSLAPDINASCARVLDKLGIQTIRLEKDGCCGAVNQHLDATEAARQAMRHNIDCWWPYISTGIEAIISTASACSLMLKDYAYFLKDDPVYADKARRVSELARDVSEVISECDLSSFAAERKERIAWHPPCTLQHGQSITGIVEHILQQCGYSLSPVIEQHLCCGAAGTYSILQAELSQNLLRNKLRNLQAELPDIIATANTGCLLHLRSKSSKPVMHWLQLLDRQDAN